MESCCFLFCCLPSSSVFDLRVCLGAETGAEKDARSTFGACSSEGSSQRQMQCLGFKTSNLCKHSKHMRRCEYISVSLLCLL